MHSNIKVRIKVIPQVGTSEPSQNQEGHSPGGPDQTSATKTMAKVLNQCYQNLTAKT